MSKAESVDERGDEIIRSDILDSTLEVVYLQIADIILQLSEQDFDWIGSSSVDVDDTWTLVDRFGTSYIQHEQIGEAWRYVGGATSLLNHCQLST
jgi:hypothetical protein